jgi:hypothetical protein
MERNPIDPVEPERLLPDGFRLTPQSALQSAHMNFVEMGMSAMGSHPDIGVAPSSHFLRPPASCRNGFACRYRVCNRTRTLDEKLRHGGESAVLQCDNPD